MQPINSHLLILFVTSCLAIPASVFGDTTSKTSLWTPPISDDEDYDWIQLVSGEWLKGELIAMYEGTLEFDSKELDEQTFDWEDIRQLHSGYRPLAIRVTDKGTFFGSVKMVDGKIVVKNLSSEFEFEQNQTFAIAQHFDEKRSSWSGKLSLGMDVTAGNTEQVDINLNAYANRRTEEDRILISYLANYSTVNDVNTIDNHRLTGQYDVFLTEAIFWQPANSEYVKDPFLNIANKYTLGISAGYHLIATKKTEWDITGGPGAMYTEFDSVQTDEEKSETSLLLAFSTHYETEITKTIDFDFLYSVQFSDKASGGYNHHTLATLEVDITKDLDFEFSVLWDRTVHPTEDAEGNTPESNDFKMVFGMGLEF